MVVKLKDVKEDLKKLEKLEDKKEFLIDILKKIKDNKLKTSVQKLLDEITKKTREKEKEEKSLEKKAEAIAPTPQITATKETETRPAGTLETRMPEPARGQNGEIKYLAEKRQYERKAVFEYKTLEESELNSLRYNISRDVGGIYKWNKEDFYELVGTKKMGQIEKTVEQMTGGENLSEKIRDLFNVDEYYVTPGDRAMGSLRKKEFDEFDSEKYMKHAKKKRRRI